MKGLTSVCLFLFTVLIAAGDSLAQNGPNPIPHGLRWQYVLLTMEDRKSSEEDPCAYFRMRVVKPPDDVDYKLRIAKPDESIDYRTIVINPCKKPEIIALGIKPNDIKNVTGSQIAPALRFRFPSGGEQKSQSGLKSPSEMLKEFALPKNPKSGQSK
jgi:hypothetical protein